MRTTTRWGLYFLMAAVAAAGLLELGFRLVKGPPPPLIAQGDSFCQPDPVLGYRFCPGAVSPSGKDVNCINNVGFRGNDVVMPKPSGVFRILCIGDSTTNGVNVHNAETWPAILEAFLNCAVFRDNRRSEVINAGFPGYVSDQHRLRLEPEYLALQPDLVVVMLGFTDVSVILMPTEASDAVRSIQRKTDWLPPGPENLLRQISSAYAWGSRWVREYVDLKRLRKTAKQDLSPEIQAALSTYAENMQAMTDGCKRAGIPVVIVNYPWNFTSRVGREDNFEHVKASIRPFEFNLYWQAMPLLEEQNIQLAWRNSLPLADVQPMVLQAKTPLPMYGQDDFSHPSVKGNFLIAATVYETLAKGLLADQLETRCDGLSLARTHLLGIPLEQ